MGVIKFPNLWSINKFRFFQNINIIIFISMLLFSKLYIFIISKFPKSYLSFIFISKLLFHIWASFSYPGFVFIFQLRFHDKASFFKSKLSNSFLSRWQSAMDAREPRDRFRHFESTLSFTDYHVACHHPVPFSARGTRQQALSHYESGSLKLQWTDKLHCILITYLNGIWGVL